MAFVQLFFNIFPALTAFGVGNGGGGAEQKYFKLRQPPKRQQANISGKTGKCSTNDDHERNDTNQNNNPYRGCCPKSTGVEKSAFGTLAEITAPPAVPDQMNRPDGTTAADYNELQFYDQLKQMIDLPILFAICFIQLISFVLVLNIEECSPLVLFSWWRNKIS